MPSYLLPTLNALDVVISPAFSNQHREYLIILELSPNASLDIAFYMHLGYIHFLDGYLLIHAYLIRPSMPHCSYYVVVETFIISYRWNRVSVLT